MHGTILDDLMLQTKADRWYLVCKIALQTRYLIRMGENPGSPTQPHAECAAGDNQSTDAIAAVRAFFESDLPCWLLMPLTQTFARHPEALDELRMKNQDEAGCPHSGNVIRELVWVRSPIAIFLNVQVPVWRLRDRNQIVELPDFWTSQLARVIHALMLNDLRSGELINIADELLDPLSGL